MNRKKVASICTTSSVWKWKTIKYHKREQKTALIRINISAVFSLVFDVLSGIIFT